jgi:hypothetical protein
LRVIPDAATDSVTLPLIADPETVDADGVAAVRGGATASEVVPVSLKLPVTVRFIVAVGAMLVKASVQVAGVVARLQELGDVGRGETIKPLGKATTTCPVPA